MDAQHDPTRASEGGTAQTPMMPHAPTDLPPVPTDLPPVPTTEPIEPPSTSEPVADGPDTAAAPSDADDTAAVETPAPAAPAEAVPPLDATQLNPAVQAAQTETAPEGEMPPAPAADAAWLNNQPKKKMSPAVIGGIAIAIVAVIAIAVFAFGSMGSNGGAEPPAAIEADDERDEKPATKEEDAQEEEPAAEEDADDATGGTIHAGTIDTSSNYSFSVESALIGTEEYTDAVCVLLVGTFTNESDETVSFGSTLGTVAQQGGYELSEVYLSGASQFNYNEIAPGQSIPVFIAWELVDGTSDVSITVTDMYHYAEAVVFEQSYTIDELIANSNAYVDSLEGFDEGMDV